MKKYRYSKFVYNRLRNAVSEMFSVLIVSVVCLSLTACEHEPVYRIGVSQCSKDDWRRKMNDEINRELMFHNNVEVEIRSADDSNEKQIADIRYFADNGFDMIIAAPNEADALTPVIKEVYERGIPVLLFDRNINGDTYTAFQGTDNSELGRLAAKYAGSLVSGECKVIEIHGLNGSTPSHERHEGFASVVDVSDNISIVGSGFGNWNYEDAKIVADSLLRLHSDANLIYAHNDRMAIGASEVARRMGLKLKVIGIDGAPEIGIKAVSDSIIDATFLYPTEGYRLIRTALAILEGKPYERRYIYPTTSVIDASNADILLLQDQSLRETTSQMGWLKHQVDEYWERHSAQTALFYALIVIAVLLFVLIFFLLRAYWMRRRHQETLERQNLLLEEQHEKQKQLNEQLQEATASKLIFFTNVSHDLRTPLSLIAEPVEQLSSAENLTPQQKTLVGLANKNLKILRRLIDEILDFRKYENNKLTANLEEVDLSGLLAEWTDAFRAAAGKRDLSLVLKIPSGKDFSLAIDPEKIERVFFNIVSNAIKYTPANGSIEIGCDIDGSVVKFYVADNGRGISKEDIGSIFDRFFQVDKINPKGSGIGLSLAKAFVELHDGHIEVESSPGKGSRFEVTLPVRHIDSNIPGRGGNYIPSLSAGSVAAELDSIDGGTLDSDDRSKPLVLVIDDNDDIRRFVGELLRDEYSLIYAADGRDGLHKAAKYIPDLILCDVMMPVMDGLECCGKLKSELSTSHIPVLMLTACSMDEQRIQGYDCGADAYISKPFNSAVLLSRCRNLIENRKRIRHLLYGDSAAEPSAVSVGASVVVADRSSLPDGDIDNEFFKRVVEIIDAEMGNPDLSVDELAGRLSLGRSQFYRKIKALTNYSPVDLLRGMRLKRARQMLASTERSISEICYAVGFSSPAYFTKCFRDRFGETPSELRGRL